MLSTGKKKSPAFKLWLYAHSSSPNPSNGQIYKVSESNKKIGLVAIFLIYLHFGCLYFGDPIAHFTDIKSYLATRCE